MSTLGVMDQLASAPDSAETAWLPGRLFMVCLGGFLAVCGSIAATLHLVAGDNATLQAVVAGFGLSIVACSRWLTEGA